MNNDSGLNLHTMTKLLVWVRFQNNRKQICEAWRDIFVETLNRTKKKFHTSTTYLLLNYRNN